MNNEALKLDDSVKQNDKGQVILGRLTGPCADFIQPTRNGRKYDESLWEKVFNDPIVNEYFEAGGYPGELDHPSDRLETCSEKIAIMMPEKPKKDKDGHLVASFDILDTPNGRIAYTLAKYGYKLGISSRGGGDTYIGPDGEEHVNEDTYDFHGFDLVLLPAVKSARLQLQESLQNGKTFKQAINESLEKATPDEKKIMTETLDNLNIEYTPEKDIDKKALKEDKQDTVAANDIGASVVKDLQESLLKQNKLEVQLTQLQEKLSVCYAKEAKYEADLVKYKNAVRTLSESAKNAKALQTKVDLLTERLNTMTANDKTQEVIRVNKLNEFLQNSKDGLVNRNKILKEKLDNANDELEKCKEENKQLRESINSLAKKNDELNEDLSTATKDIKVKTTSYSNKLSQANSIIESYKSKFSEAIDKYIECKADMLGIESNEIRNKLSNNYTFDDIDTICEQLSVYKLHLNQLPFNIKHSSDIKKVKINENLSNSSSTKSTFDDIVDDSLIKLAGLD